MMKNKAVIISVIVALVFALTGLSMFYPREQVQASTSAFETTGWSAYFSAPLKLSSVKTGAIYVTNAKGKKIKATITIQEGQKSVHVSDLKQGNYVLHVKRTAFKKGGVVSNNHDISFKIVKTLSAIESDQQLKDYFASVIRNNALTNKTTEGVAEESAQDSATGSGGESSHSTTNNQVEGIEEGDSVVVNNRYIFSMRDQSVIVTDTQDPRNLKQISTLTPVKNGYVQRVLLHNNLLLVVVNEYMEQAEIQEKRIAYPSATTMTKLFIYNVENPENAEVVRIVGQEGYFNNIRKVGNTAYMILNHTPNYWMMQEGDLPELRPLTYDSEKGEELTPMDYKDISILPGTMEPQYSIIQAIDLSSTGENTVTTKGFLGSSSGLYMSEQALYLTGFKYEQASAVTPAIGIEIWRPQAMDTDVYKWNIDGLAINFTGSATVKGTVLNQYSMDEHNGYFRIATTEGFTWDDNAPSKNHLFVLNDSMQVVGQLNNLAQGERIYSARFMGDKAYLVTFKEVDPLFVIDVADPTNPKVLGELKIPGFSNYLHPLGENHLIGIGYDTETQIDEYTKEPRIVTTSMKLSLFDVTDVTKPKEQQSVLIGGRGSYSDVQYDPKAFFRYTAKGLYGFPVILYNAKNNQEYTYEGSGALIYHISVADGIQLKGSLVEPAATNLQYEDWERTVQRIVYIGDTLYTISRSEVKSYDLNSYELLNQLKLQ